MWLASDPFFAPLLRTEQRQYEAEGNRVRIPLPGVGKDNISVSVKPNDILTVGWKGKNDTKRKVQFNIEGFVDASADYKDGMLEVTLVEDKDRAEKEIKVA